MPPPPPPPPVTVSAEARPDPGDGGYEERRRGTRPGTRGPWGPHLEAYLAKHGIEVADRTVAYFKEKADAKDKPMEKTPPPKAEGTK